MRPTFDISVQYFGIDWDHMFRISLHLIQLTEEVAAAFKSMNEENNTEIDIVLPG